MAHETAQTQKETVIEASELPSFVRAWKETLEAGATPRELATTCYHEEGLLKGTVWNEVVKGHDRITDYFIHFTHGKNEARVEFNTVNKSPNGSVAGEYTFKWLDDEGQPKATPANYTFEPATTDEGVEVIGLHHSSPQLD